MTNDLGHLFTLATRLADLRTQPPKPLPRSDCYPRDGPSQGISPGTGLPTRYGAPGHAQTHSAGIDYKSRGVKP